MRLLTALIRTVPLVLLLAIAGRGWAEDANCDDGSTASSGSDANNANSNINPCMKTVLTITGPKELYIGEVKTYTVTTNTGGMYRFFWTFSGAGEVQFKGEPSPDACHKIWTDNFGEIPCMTSSQVDVIGVKEGKVTIKVQAKSCDINKWCDGCATYDITVLNNLDSKPPEKMPLGGKYRRVDVHGVPMPDPSPTGEGEQDRIPNMAYTDMFTLAPTYAVTDVAVPMDGGELALEFRRTMGIKSRDYNPDASRRGISYPTQDYLGLGWDTNLSSRAIITTEEDSQGITYTSIKVIDETGNQLDYRAGSNPGQPQTGRYVADVTHSYNNLALRARLADGTDAHGNPTLVLTKTHGTTVTYSYTGIFNAIAVGSLNSTSCSKTLARFERYFRLTSVVDRNHNEIDVAYKSDATDDPSHANTVVTQIFDKAHPERALLFDITYDAARDEGQGLDTGWRLNSVTDPLGRVTRFGFADQGGLHAQLVSVTRPAVEDPANPSGPKASPVVSFSYFTKDLLDITLDPFNPSHGPVGVNRFAAPASITDARGHVTTFDYTPTWFPTAVYASMGNVPVWQQKLIVTTETTVDGPARFSQEQRDPSRVTTHVVDTRGTSTGFDFTSTTITGLPTNTGSAIVVDHFTRTTGMPDGHDLVADFRWSHDLNGNLTRVVDLSGNAITFAYHSSLTGDPYDQPVNGGGHDDNLNPYFYQIFDKPSNRTITVAGAPLITQYFYDTRFNKEVRTIDAEGKATDEHLDANGNRDLLTEPLGKITRFAYASDGFITQTTDPDGRVTVAARVYAPATPLAYLTITTTVKGYVPDGATDGDVQIISQTVADLMGNQRSQVDPRGFEAGNSPATFTTTALFDDLNRQVSVTKPPIESTVGGPLVTTTSETHYDLNGNVVRSVDDEGNVSTMVYDLMNRVIESRRLMTNPLSPDDANDLVTRTSYNPVGLPQTTADAKGFVTDFTYDNMLRLTTKTLPTVTLPGGSTVRYTEQYTYGPKSGSGAFTHWSGWQPTRVVNTRGFATDTTYDEIYRPIQVISRLTKEAQWGDAAADGEPVVTKTYNKVHKVLTESSRNETFQGADQTRTTTYTYDDLYRVVTTTVSLDGGDLVSHAGYDLAGDMTSTTDAQGNRTDMVFDGAKRQRFQYQPTVTVTDPAGFNPTGSSLRPTTESRYDAAGNVVLSIDPNHTQMQRTYDFRNRLIGTIIDVTGEGTFDPAPYPATPQTDIATQTHYDRVGKPVQTRDGRGFVTTTVYDRAYRVVQVIQPLVADAVGGGSATPVVTTAYDKNGNVTDMIDPRGEVTHTAYDELNRVRTVTQVAQLTSANPDTVVTESQYDEANNVTALILHNTGFGGTGDQKTDYTYDGLNRKLTETLPSPDGQARVTTMAYYRNGQLRTSRDPLGQETDLSYDRAGRMTMSLHRRADSSVEETRLYQYNAVGKPTTVDDLAGESVYVYDALYRVTLERRAPSQPGQLLYEVVSGYDARGARTRVIYPDSHRTLVSTADRAGRIVRIQDAGRITYYQFDANGNRLSVEEPNGVVTVNTLDALNRCTTALTQNASAGLVSRYDYQFDLVGNRVRVDENLPPQPLRTTLYGYDHQYRLVSEATPDGATPAFRNVYTYDPAGNRQTLTAQRGPVTIVTTYICDALNRLLRSSIGPVTTKYIYDLNGNQISQVFPLGLSISFVWDTHNRLVGGTALSAGLGAATASYDYRTRRQTKRVEGVTTFYRYDQGDSFQELGGSSIKEEIVRGSGMGGGIGSILYTDRTLAGGPVENFAYNPSVGHVTSLTNDSGAITETNRYDAFGNIISTSGHSDNNHLANTKERDASLPGVFVLDNHGMRYYNPVTGRYISRDSAPIPNSPNYYLYVGDNPINRIDPLGLFWGGLWELTKAVGQGLAQGACNVVNGAQDAVIGLANVPSLVLNTVTNSHVAGYIPSPDWSKDAVVSSELYNHDLSKGLGGAGALGLAGGPALAGIAKLGTVGNAAAATVNTLGKLAGAANVANGTEKLVNGNAWGLVDVGLGALSFVPGPKGEPSAPKQTEEALGDIKPSQTGTADAIPEGKSLSQMAEEIRVAGTGPAKNQRTIAVGEDAEGNLYAGSSNGFDKGQRAAADSIGVLRVPSRKGNHAEENLMDAVDDLKRVGTSKRAPCGPDEHDCAQQLKDRGIEVENHEDH